LEQKLLETLHEKNLNVIHTNLETFQKISATLATKFSKYNIKFTNIKLIDVSNVEEIEELIAYTHKRAHRGWKENMTQLLKTHYFEEMTKKFKQYALNCNICHACKYNRHPRLELIGKTPIPEFIGQILHIDIFFINKKRFITCVDSYSKYLIIKENVKAINEIREILNIYPNCTTIMTDNDPILTSFEIKNYLDRRNINQVRTAVNHSVTNGQVERTHSTLIEIIRCLIKEKSFETNEAVYEAAKEYNQTIHSVIKEKPLDVFNNSNKYNLKELLTKNQEQILKFHNKNREEKKVKVNEEVWTKNNRRNKLEDRFRKVKIKEIQGHTVKTSDNKLHHKGNLKCSPRL
jgi:serine/threonine-protein phosphatase PP1 catalytic subunit